ncbi:RNA polymerase sigma-70 factor, ECF subfamily [Lampropedia hyalina DSM 16112]|uniref:RNA polymerase sigma-70 factor, ECF subfamily n=1 Tax=Lampropedia hyalina DSM 16112 TaxID=1122156 RepID=A0A1M5BAZ6_9BURK|nr:RNA polymerase sigma factor [Lampropedia hyalina]SHF39679.1 RNA polymerase sigma-70 factor, ECF subfamily [Lampropedia hyalina DSM 16112]
MPVMEDGVANSLSTQNYQELLNFCTRHTRNRDDAADLVQETYARALALMQAQSPSTDAVQDVRALLYRTLRNLLIDQHRRRQLRQHESLEHLSEAEWPLLPAHLQPEAVLAFSQYARAIVAAIESLPPRCREAFVLSRFDGWPHQRIAEHMGISRNMVAQHMVRGILVCKAAHQRFHQSPLPGVAGH